MKQQENKRAPFTGFSLPKWMKTGSLLVGGWMLAIMNFAATPPDQTPKELMIDETAMDWLRFTGICLFIMVLLIAWITLVVTVKDPEKISVQALVDELTSKNLTAPEMDHVYDGITELDNPMPAWLKLSFYASIVFAIGYMFHYHVFKTGDLQLAEYAEEVAWADANYKDVELPDEAIKLVTDEISLSAAQIKFNELCAPCHVEDMGGDVGPNLTDAYWLHGGDVKDLYRVISNGVPGKGMISWKKMLTSKERLAVASYILSMQGTHPAVPKDPQGELWSPDGEAVLLLPEDSLAIPIKIDSLAQDTAAPE